MTLPDITPADWQRAEEIMLASETEDLKAPYRVLPTPVNAWMALKVRRVAQVLASERSRREAAEKALRKYGQHMDCDKVRFSKDGYEHECSCGLNAALKRLEG